MNPNKNLVARPRHATHFPLDHFFEDFWGLKPFKEWGKGFIDQSLTSFSPKCEIEETDKEFLLHFEVPGMKPDEIQVEVNDGVLSVSGERKRSEERKEKNYHYSERSYGSFRRNFTLPENVDMSGVDAKHDQGLLTVVLPKKATTVPKRITIHPSKH